MTDSLWDRTWTLFHAALELDDAQRDKFLDTACAGDEGLRREIRELLASYKASGMLDRSPALAVVHSADADPLSGKRIGRYLIHKKIGEGGMGVVYDAEQETPVRRRVAVKVIHPGTHPDATARFALEKQALALMSHPHIARVFDAGMTEDGRPFIAIEHVAGVPLTEYCDHHRLDLRERLELFLHVCNAIQHAHQKGIIHRDIKPSNVLVSVEDGVPTPKVIDFGVAKSLRPILEDQGRRTVNEMVIGTLEYMSPEQLARDEHADIDTRSDIYSLGVMLYELLAGVLPYDWARLRKAGLEGLRKLTQESEPPCSSRRFLDLEPGTAAKIAAARRTTAQALPRQLAGDLDWILLKALDRDRTRRYATAAEFADDLRRQLASEPVLAGPPSATYRFGKFVRRHRTGVAAAAVIAIMLTGAAAMLTRQSIEIRRAAEQADRERVRAERVSEIMVDVFKASDPFEGRGADVTAREVLDRSTERVRQLDDEPEVKASVLNAMGSVYSQMTLYDSADKLIRESLSIRRGLHQGDHLETADSLESLGLVELGRTNYRNAGRLLEQSIAMKRRLLPPDDPRRLEGLHALGRVRRSDGHYKESEALLQEALRLSRSGDARAARSTTAILEELGRLYYKNGDSARAESSFRDVLAIRRKQGPDTPRAADTMVRLAMVLSERGDHTGGEAFLRQSLAVLEKNLGPDHERLCDGLTNLGLSLHHQGKYDEAEANYRRSLAIWRAKHGDQHPSGIMTLNNLALLAHDRNRFAEAEALFGQTLALYEKRLSKDHPDLALPMCNIARVYHDQGRFAEAETLYRRSLAMRRKGLKADAPPLADSLVWLGKLLTEKKQFAEAEAVLREGVAIRAKAFAKDDWRNAEARSLLGGCLAAQKRFAEAEPLLVDGYAIMEKKRGKSYRRTLQALERVVALYDSWERPADAARYRDMLKKNRPSA